MTLSGGEPTLLRRRLVATIRKARAAGLPFVELQTNAVLITPDYARALAQAGLTSAFVSLLSHDSAIHDELAGLHGAFPKCISGIRALAAVGVPVTLNPVLTSRSQDGWVDYLRFVAAELPEVRSISVSAVQPHGRAADGELLPAYDQLAPQIREGHRIAEAAGIKLLNPYCGLPLCIGWEQHMDRCVEAEEARAPGIRPINLQNDGNKAHGPPCRGCGFRTRCGGAWHAVWARGGQGLRAPQARRTPWEGAPWVDVSRLAPGLESGTWLLSNQLTQVDAETLEAAGVFDLALQWPAGRATLARVRRLTSRRALPQRQFRVSLGAMVRARDELWALAQLVRAAGVDELVLLPGSGEGLAALGQSWERTLGLTVRSVGALRVKDAEGEAPGSGDDREGADHTRLSAG